MRSLALAAALAATAGLPAAARTATFTSPTGGAPFAAGTTGAPQGVASQGVTSDLNLAVIVDTSGSTDGRPLSASGDDRFLLDVAIDAIASPFTTLPDGAWIAERSA
jgi:hypothetical protein